MNKDLEFIKEIYNYIDTSSLDSDELLYVVHCKLEEYIKL